ncbi:MAG: hypothetical protein QOK21_2513 [Solirubrobacteraceae bacterium]|nr:hypothetical protein [Solirubrobacteraceae bacterium]
MSPFRPRDERVPPAAVRVTDVAVLRFEGIYEVDPALMQEHVAQQDFPNWDTLRIARSRHDHLEWMHRHWTDTVVSGEALLADVEHDPNPGGTP